MAVYIRLFHGRTDPDEDLSDWGSDGPVLGPFDFAHITYASDIKFGEGDLGIGNDGLVFYDGVYYGDVSVFGPEELRADGFTPQPFEQEKAGRPTFHGA